MLQVSEILKKIPFLKGIREEELEFVIGRLKFKRFAEKELIGKAGDPSENMYIIINGQVKVSLPGKHQNEEVIIARLKGGSFFGDMALVSGAARPASVTAVKDSEMLILNKRDVDIIIQRFSRVGQRIREIKQMYLQADSAAAVGHGEQEPFVFNFEAYQKRREIGKKLAEGHSVSSEEEKGEFYVEKQQLEDMILKGLGTNAREDLRKWKKETLPFSEQGIDLDALQRKKTEFSRNQNARVLVVNQSAVIRKLLERTLEAMNYEVHTAKTAAEAMECIRSVKPALVLADTRLKDISGIELMGSIRSLTNVPLVFLAESSADNPLKKQAREQSGVYFTTSQRIDDVREAVRAVERNQQTTRS